MYITTILKADPENEKLTDAELLQRAWKVQFSNVDVDKDCLALLEEEMFERSARAGVAGHCQWGLDIGDHDGWDLYRDVPGYFNHGDRAESESELQTGPHYKSVPVKVTQIDLRPQPKPRPIAKKVVKQKKM
ncbi:hypothetical protein K443DRAFT_642500 [Laccaria amethystina LaAM-08-1]|uniref:Uncharacterized protein n=1 Tax=Laccaria amethystina LaAM-08-1 TaxID=1095629 RepID=A0A0C9WJ72_9AGAR|nr:hypothetical protein K443DRAFT_642500 [Laccaria amethystina LaAM-08-1]